MVCLRRGRTECVYPRGSVYAVARHEPHSPAYSDDFDCVSLCIDLQRCAALRREALKRVCADRYGGLENRVEMAADVLSFQKLDQQERLSYTEDIDLTELLTKLTRQQLTYQTVLQSSSMIMKLSLANYI